MMTTGWAIGNIVIATSLQLRRKKRYEMALIIEYRSNDPSKGYN
jgi:hypothetical protein